MFSMVSQLLKPAINLLFIVICTFQKASFCLVTEYCLPHPNKVGFFVTQHDLLQSDQAMHALHLLISCSSIGFLTHRHLGIL